MDCLAPLGQVYQAGTLSGNPVAMSAALATFEEIEKEGFYERLSLKAERLLNPIRKAIADKKMIGCLNQAGSMFSLFLGVSQVKSREDLQGLDENRFAHFFRYLFERKIYIAPSAFEASFISSAHTEEHLDYTAQTICEYIRDCYYDSRISD